MTKMRRARLLCVLVLIGLASPYLSIPADHNDPNAINAIFWDVKMNGADLYDLYGFPTQDERGGERVAVALTFGAVPGTGVLDPDLFYRSSSSPVREWRARPRRIGACRPFSTTSMPSRTGTWGSSRSRFVSGPKERTARKIDFIDFPGGAVSQVIDTNQSVTLKAPDGSDINVFVGGRDDAFFNDLPGSSARSTTRRSSTTSRTR